MYFVFLFLFQFNDKIYSQICNRLLQSILIEIEYFGINSERKKLLCDILKYCTIHSPQYFNNYLFLNLLSSIYSNLTKNNITFNYNTIDSILEMKQQMLGNIDITDLLFLPNGQQVSMSFTLLNNFIMFKGNSKIK